MSNPTETELRYMAKVKKLSCCCCGASPPSFAHHIRSIERAREAGFTIPLCFEHHVGDFSIHKTPEQFQAVYGSQVLLLAKTIIDVNEGER